MVTNDDLDFDQIYSSFLGNGNLPFPGRLMTLIFDNPFWVGEIVRKLDVKSTKPLLFIDFRAYFIFLSGMSENLSNISFVLWGNLCIY